MAGSPLTADTLLLVRKAFAPAAQREAAQLLESRCGANLPLMGEATPAVLERVRFAAIKVAGGSLPELERAVAVANEDWRDLLVAAGFADSLTVHRAWWQGVTAG